MATVWIPSAYRALADGAQTVVVPGATVRQVTRNLDNAYPGFWERLVDEERGRIRAGVTVVVNGVSVGYALHEPIGENDEVHYLPAIAGGAEETLEEEAMPEEDDIEQFIAAAGGIEVMVREGEDYSRRCRLLDSHVLDLLKQRPNQWLALCEGDVWVFAESEEELLHALDQRGLRRNNAVYRHLDPDRPIHILAVGRV